MDQVTRNYLSKIGAKGGAASAGTPEAKAKAKKAAKARWEEKPRGDGLLYIHKEGDMYQVRYDQVLEDGQRLSCGSTFIRHVFNPWCESRKEAKTMIKEMDAACDASE